MDQEAKIKELELEIARLKGVIEGMSKNVVYPVRTYPVYPTYPTYPNWPHFYSTTTPGTINCGTSTAATTSTGIN